MKQSHSLFTSQKILCPLNLVGIQQIPLNKKQQCLVLAWIGLLCTAVLQGWEILSSDTFMHSMTFCTSMSPKRGGWGGAELVIGFLCCYFWFSWCSKSHKCHLLTIQILVLCTAKNNRVPAYNLLRIHHSHALLEIFQQNLHGRSPNWLCNTLINNLLGSIWGMSSFLFMDKYLDLSDNISYQWKLI